MFSIVPENGWRPSPFTLIRTHPTHALSLSCVMSNRHEMDGNNTGTIWLLSLHHITYIRMCYMSDVTDISTRVGLFTLYTYR